MSKREVKMMRIDADTYRALRVVAAEHGKSVSAMATELIEAGIAPSMEKRRDALLAALARAGYVIPKVG